VTAGLEVDQRRAGEPTGEPAERASGPLWSFVLALALGPVVLFSVYLEVAAAVDRAYRSAQLINPPVWSVIGYAVSGLAGPVVAGVVLLAAWRWRSSRPLAVTTVALCAETTAAVVGVVAGLWLLHAGVT
jgi:hypothetical protein